jgi:hypothetical protein
MPCPLGLIAPLAGTPLAIVSNFTDLTQERVHYLQIQALPGNTANVYVLNNQLAADKVAYTNVLAVIGAGQAYVPTLSSQVRNLWRLSSFWIDSDVNGEGAIVTVVQE